MTTQAALVGRISCKMQSKNPKLETWPIQHGFYSHGPTLQCCHQLPLPPL